jgi:hypothetical protein
VKDFWTLLCLARNNLMNEKEHQCQGLGNESRFLPLQKWMETVSLHFSVQWNDYHKMKCVLEEHLLAEVADEMIFSGG